MNDPLVERYGSKITARIWSPENRLSIYRDLWLWLAEAQKLYGFPISDDQIKNLRHHCKLQQADTQEILNRVKDHEQQCHHEITAHIRAIADESPEAAKIIHIGATSCYITDNADLIQISQSLFRLRAQVENVIRRLAILAKNHVDHPTLAYTHLQPAQITTWGKRFCIYINDLLIDLADLQELVNGLKIRGIQGAVGTQSGLMNLFDDEAIDKINYRIAASAGMNGIYQITGQTYTRKIDSRIVSTVCRIAQSAHKFGVDMRLLAGQHEIDEGFQDDQVGSSAMPYKRNPMYCERLCGLSRYLMNLESNFSSNHANQWLERSLDDSSNRRLAFPAIFLTADAILGLYAKIVFNLSIETETVAENVQKHMPYLATESLLMVAVKQGGDRQKLHDRIRTLTMKNIAVEDLTKEIIVMLSEEFPEFDFKEHLEKVIDPAYHTRHAIHQVNKFLTHVDDELDPTP